MCILGYLFLVLAVSIGQQTSVLDCKWQWIQTWLVYLICGIPELCFLFLLNKLKHLATYLFYRTPSEFLKKCQRSCSVRSLFKTILAHLFWCLKRIIFIQLTSIAIAPCRYTEYSRIGLILALKSKIQYLIGRYFFLFLQGWQFVSRVFS